MPGDGNIKGVGGPQVDRGHTRHDDKEGADAVGRAYKRKAPDSSSAPAKKALEGAGSSSTEIKSISDRHVDPLHDQENVGANRGAGIKDQELEQLEKRLFNTIDSRTAAAKSIVKTYELLRISKKEPIFVSDAKTTVLEGDLSNKSIEGLSTINDRLKASSEDLKEYGRILSKIYEYDAEIEVLMKKLKPYDYKAPKIPGEPAKKIKSLYNRYKKRISDRKVYVSDMLEAAAATKIQSAFRGKRERMRGITEARKKRFDAIFTEKEKDSAVKHGGISRDVVDKIVEKASLCWRQGQGLVRVQDEATKQISAAIVSPGVNDISPKITVPGEQIGEGSFGTVSKVFQLSTGTFAAFKQVIIYTEEYAEENIRDILTEAARLKELGGHDGIQSAPYEVVDITSKDRSPVAGHISKLYSGTADDITPQTPKQLKRCSRELLSGLVYLHESGYVHCDIKTGNIFMEAPELAGEGIYKAVLGDFGGASSFKHLEQVFFENKKDKKTVKCLPRILWETFTTEFCAQAKAIKPTKDKSVADQVFELNELFDDVGDSSLATETFADVAAATKAYNDGDFEKYKEIMKANDVYALGLSIILAFALKKDHEGLSEETLLKIQDINSRDRLPRYIRKALKKKGFSKEQINTLEEMVCCDCYNRPTAKKALEAFSR